MEKQVIETLIELTEKEIEDLKGIVYGLQHYSGKEHETNILITKIASYKIAIDKLNKLKDFEYPSDDEIAKASNENIQSTWRGHSQGYYYHFHEGCEWMRELIKSKLS